MNIFARSIRSVLLGAPLASGACVLVVLILVSQLTTEQLQTTSSLLAHTARDAVAANQLQHAITSTHARLYRTLLWLSMEVDDVDPGVVPGEIQGELSLNRAARLSSAIATEGNAERRRLLESISENLGRYGEDTGVLLDIAAADPAMATLMMSRTEQNVDSLSEDVARLLEISKGALTDRIPVLLAQQAEERCVGYQVIVIALLVSIIATGSVTGPIRRLTRAMVRARAGGIDAFLDAATDRRDTIGAMSRAFSELERERQTTATALRKSHEELEGLINARTAELEQTNAELRQQIAERNTVEAALRQGKQKNHDILDGSLQGVMMVRSHHIYHRH